jgi:hypothetical protein
MPFVRSLIFKCLACCFKLIAVIFLFNKIMLSYSCCIEKGLVYIIIITSFSWQPSSYSECTKLNIYLSYNIYFISNTKCIYLAVYLCTL